MKVVIFGPAYPFRGGVPHFAGALAAALRKAGHEVALVNFERLFPAWLFPGKSQIDDSAHALRMESERVLVPWKPRTWKAAAAAIAAHKPDLILSQWWMPPFALAYRAVFHALPPQLQARFVTVLHDVISHERRPFDKVLARIGLNCSPRFLALSDSEASRLRALLPGLRPEQIRVTPHPVFDSYAAYPGTIAEARAELGVPEGADVLLFFGFVRRYKGLDILLRALPAVLAKRPRLKLLVCGPFHEPRAKYERLITSLELESVVVLHDRYFSGADVSVCLAAADVVALPYRAATQSGVVPLCYALHTPVIATRVGALTEVVRDGVTGLLIPPEDPAALADAILKFYERGGKSAFAGAVRAEAARYSWDEMIACIANLSGDKSVAPS